MTGQAGIHFLQFWLCLVYRNFVCVKTGFAGSGGVMIALHAVFYYRAGGTLCLNQRSFHRL